MFDLYDEVNPGQIFSPEKTIYNFPVALLNNFIEKLNYHGGDITVSTEVDGIVYTFDLTTWMGYLVAAVAPRWVTNPIGGFADEETGEITLSAYAAAATTYQWKQWDGTSWIDIEGETGTSITLTPTEPMVVANFSVSPEGFPSRSFAANIAPFPLLLEGYQFADLNHGKGITGTFSASRKTVLQYNGNYVLTSGGAIQTLYDQGGLTITGMNLTQASAGLRPAVATVNGVQVARFDGVDDLLVNATLADNLILHANGYIAVSGVLRAVTTNDPGIDYNNRVVSDQNNYFGLYLKNDGTDISIIGMNYDGGFDVSAGTVIAEGSIIDVPAVFEWQHSDGLLRSRVSKAGVLGTWTAGVASGNTQNLGFNIQLGYNTQLGVATQLDIAELSFANSVPTAQQQDTLALAMLDYLEGNPTEPWMVFLPSYGQPWETLINLDTPYIIDGRPCEIQRAVRAALYAYRLSARNPDYDVVQRFELHAGDFWIGNNSNRVEVEVQEIGLVPGQEFWFAGTFMIGSETTDPDRFLMWQLHASSADPIDTDGTSAVCGMRYGWQTPGYLLFETLLSTTIPAYDGQVNTVFYNEPVEKDTPISMVLNWKPDPTGTNGWFKVWLDGVLVVNTRVASGFTAADSYYLKFGAYNGAETISGVAVVQWSGMEWGQESLEHRVRSPRRTPF